MMPDDEARYAREWASRGFPGARTPDALRGCRKCGTAALERLSDDRLLCRVCGALNRA